MNPAAFRGSHGTRASSPLYAHSTRVARSSLGETATPRARHFVVNLPIDID
jgi:hypothetical protein